MKQLSLALLLVIGFIACDRPPCTNENQVFDQNEPETKVYKDELVRLLQNTDETNLRYWLKKYQAGNGEEFLHFYVQGDSLCAILVLTMHDWGTIEDVKEQKGAGYRGAEFKDLKFEIRQDYAATEFIFTSVGSIID